MNGTLVGLLALACAQDNPGGGSVPLEPSDLPAVERQSIPLTGGGLAVGHDWVGASDPDDDRVRLVHTQSDEARDMHLGEGLAPTNVAWTPWTEGVERLHVLLRGTGAVAVIDPGAELGGQPLLVNVQPVCAAPRGIAWDDGRAQMWVVCGGGELVGVSPSGDPAPPVWLDDDLRDVVVLDDGLLLVSRLRTAEVLVVDPDGDGPVTARWTPPSRYQPASGHTLIPRVLRRMVPLLSGQGAAVMYQLHDDGPLENDPTGVPPYYGDPLQSPCLGLVHPVLSVVRPDSGFEVEQLVGGTVVVDLAVVTDTELPVVATPSGLWVDFTLTDLDDQHTCASAVPAFAAAQGLLTSVARDGDVLWASTRQPFAVAPAEVLADEPVEHSTVFYDQGLGLFHSAPKGIACVSCHPEGGDDGHTWLFVPEGPRRTQALGGIRISETAPFHWDGTLATFDDLFEDVGVIRMGMAAVADTGELLTFLDGFPRAPTVGRPPNAALAAEGAALFADEAVGCARCHSGWRYSNGATEDVGTGGAFQVPPLIGVEARLPLMHTGCASTLRQRFDDVACGGGDQHGVTSQLDDHQLDALVAFLQTL